MDVEDIFGVFEDSSKREQEKETERSGEGAEENE